MNLRELIKVVNDVYPKLKLQTKSNSSPESYEATGILSTKEGIKTLIDHGLNIGEINNLWTHFFSKYSESDTLISKDEYYLLFRSYEYIQISIEALHNQLNQFHPPEYPNSVLIKLTPTIDFDDLKNISNDLNKSLSVPINHKSIDGSVKIESVENGSIWLVVALGTPLAVGLVGSIVWASAVINKKRQEAKIFEEHVASLKLANSEKEIFLKAQEAQVQALIQAETENVGKHHYSNYEPEDIERLKHSIITISELINKGLEIHPSLNSPENVSNLFPDFKKLNLIESRTKQISETGHE